MIPNDPEEIRRARPRGTWVAHQLAVRGLAAVCVLSMACIPTEEIDFPEEPACPPSIVAPPGAPPIGIVTLDRLTATGDGGTGGMATFEVDIRDCNVDQALEFEAWLDFSDFGGVITLRPLHGNEGPRPIERSGSSVRELVFPVDPAVFDADPDNPECHTVELFVSSNFRTIREPPGT